MLFLMGAALPAARRSCPAVILACRSVARGEALKEDLEQQAQAAGQPQPLLEVGARGAAATSCTMQMCAFLRSPLLLGGSALAPLL